MTRTIATTTGLLFALLSLLVGGCGELQTVERYDGREQARQVVSRSPLGLGVMKNGYRQLRAPNETDSFEPHVVQAGQTVYVHAFVKIAAPTNSPYNINAVVSLDGNVEDWRDRVGTYLVAYEHLALENADGVLEDLPPDVVKWYMRRISGVE